MTELELNITALRYTTSEKTGDKSSGYIPTDWEVFLILQEFFQPNSKISPEEAVDRIIAIFPDGYSDLRSINDVCLELAEQIPYHHPSQLKLVRLLWLIGRNETRIKNHSSQDKPVAYNAFYQHLAEDVTDNNSSPEDDDVTPDRYINFQAFLANLMQAGLWLPSPNGALIAMRGAFEQNNEGKSPAIQEAWIMGAAQWILWNGQGLFKLLLWPTDTPLKGEEPFTRKSWQDWTSGFQVIAESDRYGEECMLIAQHSAQLMHALEITCTVLTGH